MAKGKKEKKKVRNLYDISRSIEAFYRKIDQDFRGFFRMGVTGCKLNRLIRGGRRINRFGVPPLTPKGYVPVCVGVNDDTRRFIVHTTTLRNADFLEMLCKSAEENGFF